MISLPLLKRNILSGIKIFIIIFAFLCMYTTVIIYMYAPELAEMINDYQKAMPEVMSAFGMTGIASNLTEWIGIYLYGFIMLLFPLIFIIILGNKLVIGYIDNGSMAGLLSTPNSRKKIIITQALSAVIWLVLLMICISIVGIVCSEVMFPGNLNVVRYIQLNAATLLLWFTIFGIAFFAACIFSELKHYYLLGAGLPILFFMVQMIGNMGDKLEGFKYLTIYTLLPVNKIIAGESGVWINNVILVLISLVLIALGCKLFTKRDLSI